jgi:hypothetical protein
MNINKLLCIRPRNTLLYLTTCFGHKGPSSEYLRTLNHKLFFSAMPEGHLWPKHVVRYNNV